MARKVNLYKGNIYKVCAKNIRLNKGDNAVIYDFDKEHLIDSYFIKKRGKLINVFSGVELGDETENHDYFDFILQYNLSKNYLHELTDSNVSEDRKQDIMGKLEQATVGKCYADISLIGRINEEYLDILRKNKEKRR